MSTAKYIIIAACLLLAPLALSSSAIASPLPADLTRFTVDSPGQWTSHTDRRAARWTPRAQLAFQQPSTTTDSVLHSAAAPAKPLVTSSPFAAAPTTSKTLSAAPLTTPKLILTNWANGANVGYSQTTPLYRSPRTYLYQRYNFNAVYQGALTPVITNGAFATSPTRHLIPQAPGLYAQTGAGLEYSSLTVQSLAAGAIPNPLPGAFPLMASAIIGLGYVRFRRKKKQL